MDLDDCCLLPPSMCFTFKSNANSWLCIDRFRNIRFSRKQEESCAFFLLPCTDGRYMLQLCPSSLADLHENFTEPCALSCYQGESGFRQPKFCDSWLFCKQGPLIVISQYARESHDKFCFSLEFDDLGCVALSSGLVNKEYWTLDASGLLIFDVRNNGKRETFQLHEYYWSMDALKPSWTCMVPVRINFRAHTGQYLCAATTVISAAAEVPCCCEEFLLDVSFPPLPPAWKSSYWPTISGSIQSSHCNVRTANGTLNWIAGSEGKLMIVQLSEAQAGEHFMVHVLPHNRHSMVSISHHFAESHPYYVSVEPSSRVTCNKLQRGKAEEFMLELANESRILIQSVHGYFMGSQEPSMVVKTCSFSRSYERNDTQSSVGAWRLKAHGDSSYTLVSATSPRDQGDVYLYVDGRGKIMQSNEPGVHFPSSSSLFEIKPVARACFTRISDSSARQSDATTAIVGFTIKTTQKINGKRRYFRAEPNGVLTANAVSVSRWGVFQLIDVDATASAVLPHEFLCVPAAVNLVAARNPVAPISLLQDKATLGSRSAAWQMDQGSIRGLFESAKYELGKRIESIESMKKASQVAAMATRTGRCLPKQIPASLQELCINQICLQASAEVARLNNKFQDSISIAWVTECLVESCVGIPDDLCAKIVSCWCARQHPENLCKSSLRRFSSHSNRNGRNFEGASYIAEQSFGESNDKGFHCHSCNRKGILEMNPSINPAHHRYLEVQYQEQHAVAQPTGFLWNLISFAGVSVMSTALLLHFFSDHNKKQRSCGSMH